MKDRLIAFLKYLGIGQDKFAKNVGLSRGYVNNNKDNITMRTVDKILKAYPELNKSWLLTGEGEMLNENHPENLQSQSTKKDGENRVILDHFEHNFNEIIAIGKTNAESFKKVAESHDILMKSHDKLLDLFKESLSVKNNSKIDVLIEKFDDFLKHSKQTN